MATTPTTTTTTAMSRPTDETASTEESTATTTATTTKAGSSLAVTLEDGSTSLVVDPNGVNGQLTLNGAEVDSAALLAPTIVLVLVAVLFAL